MQENVFGRLGEVPKVVDFENGSCAVNHADWYDAELHSKIVDFCNHYHFTLVPTRPRTPRHKGKIERGIGYVKNTALKGITFESLATQNEHLDRWEANRQPQPPLENRKATKSRTQAKVTAGCGSPCAYQYCSRDCVHQETADRLLDEWQMTTLDHMRDVHFVLFF